MLLETKSTIYQEEEGERETMGRSVEITFRVREKLVLIFGEKM
jgi:hypothetical protein